MYAVPSSLVLDDSNILTDRSLDQLSPPQEVQKKRKSQRNFLGLRKYATLIKIDVIGAAVAILRTRVEVVQEADILARTLRLEITKSKEKLNTREQLHLFQLTQACMDGGLLGSLLVDKMRQQNMIGAIDRIIFAARDEAALIAARGEQTKITMDHFEGAINKIIGGLEKKHKVGNVDHLVENLCTVWIGRMHLHPNVVRYDRPLISSSRPNVAPRPTVNSVSRPSANGASSFVSVLKVASWFSQLRTAQSDFVSRERIVWIDIEGVPLHAWSRPTFSKIGSRWGEVLELEDNKDDCFA
ncbi:RNA-directed DNA polymerase, eukaryota, partial [Tanacetum coccineum]